MKPQSEYAKPIKDYVQLIDKERRNPTIALGYIFLSVSTSLFISIEEMLKNQVRRLYRT